MGDKEGKVVGLNRGSADVSKRNHEGLILSSELHPFGTKAYKGSLDQMLNPA